MNICLPMGSSKWIPCFVLFAHAAFLCKLSLSQPMNFCDFNLPASSYLRVSIKDVVLSELLWAMTGFWFFFVFSGIFLAFVIIEAWGLPWWVLSKPDRSASKPLLIQFFLISLFGIKSCDKTILPFFPLWSFITFLLNG